MNHIAMFFIMILSGLLSTMNVYADKIKDMRLSVNDFYMAFLMTGWMFFFMGIYMNNIHIIIFGLLSIIISIYCIRTQLFISEKQYINGMIPHHSMAVFMSKKLLEKGTHIKEFVEKIVSTQENEIKYMKTKAT